jgi:hypothetical protein
MAAAERNGELGDDQAGSESRGGRRKRASAKPSRVEGKAHKLTISDAVFLRLDLAAKRKKPPVTMSMLANHILNLSLPHYDVKEVDRAPDEE